MIIGLSGQNTNLMALIIQYVIYCDKMAKLHPTFTYPVERFAKHVLRTDYSLTDETEWIIKSFDYKVKQCVSIILDIPIEKLDDERFLNSSLSPDWVRHYYTDHKGKKRRTHVIDPNPDFYITEIMTVRQFIECFSFDACSNAVHTNFWTNSMFNSYIKTQTSTYHDISLTLIYNPVYDGDDSEHLFNYPNWIIKDVNDITQADAITAREGIVIRVYPMEVEDKLDGYIFSGSVDISSNMAYSVQQTKTLLIKLKII